MLVPGGEGGSSKAEDEPTPDVADETSEAASEESESEDDELAPQLTERQRKAAEKAEEKRLQVVAHLFLRPTGAT